MVGIEVCIFMNFFSLPRRGIRDGRENIQNSWSNPPILGSVRMLDYKDDNLRVSFQCEVLRLEGCGQMQEPPLNWDNRGVDMGNNLNDSALWISTNNNLSIVGVPYSNIKIDLIKTFRSRRPLFWEVEPLFFFFFFEGNFFDRGWYGYSIGNLSLMSDYIYVELEKFTSNNCKNLE